MGLLSLFVKKKEAKPALKEVPLSKVEDMVSKGLSMRQMVDYLKSEGYSIDLIDKAFAQLQSKKDVLTTNAGPVNEPLQALPVASQELPLVSEPEDSLPEISDVNDSPLEDDNEVIGEDSVDKDVSRVGNVESLVEVIVEEKFSDLVDKIDELTGLKESVDSKIDAFSSEVTDLKHRLAELEKFKNEGLSVQRKALDEFRLEIGAMEKAFQKLVPSLSANLRKSREEKGKGKDSEE